MRRTLLAVAGVMFALASVNRASAQKPARAEAGLSMMMSPSSNSRIPELMVGPMLNVKLAEAAGGVIGVEGAMR